MPVLHVRIGAARRLEVVELDGGDEKGNESSALSLSVTRRRKEWAEGEIGCWALNRFEPTAQMKRRKGEEKERLRLKNRFSRFKLNKKNILENLENFENQ